MKQIRFNDTNTGEEITIAYADYGDGQPVILIHGWPSSHRMWEYQMGDFVTAGYRVITYDRRGFGDSSKPWSGYDYNILASDLHELIEQLELSNVILIGFSMGGGEVARYLSKYGADRVARVALISTVLPYMLKGNDNPDGVDEKVFSKMAEQVKQDRPGFLEQFGKMFFGVGFLNKLVTDAYLRYFDQLALAAIPQSTLACITAFATTDFRKDLAAIKMPALIIHGDNDEIVPLDVSSQRTATMLPHAEFIIYENGPHGIFYTHRDLLNQHLVDFFRGKKHQPPAPEPILPTPL
jgi:pimeloyl-ACP methyl ester carboxylesterase